MKTAQEIIVALKAMKTPRELAIEEEGPNATEQAIEDTASNNYCEMAEERDRAIDALITAARDCKTPMDIRADALRSLAATFAAAAKTEANLAASSRAKRDKAKHEARAQAYIDAMNTVEGRIAPVIEGGISE